MRESGKSAVSGLRDQAQLAGKNLGRADRSNAGLLSWESLMGLGWFKPVRVGGVLVATIVLVLTVMAGSGFFFSLQSERTRTEDNTMASGHFSPDYVTARSRFRRAVESSGGRLKVLNLNAKGPDGEDLTIDIGWFGNPAPRRVLLHSSGLHGVEGFAGSAIQLQLLEKLPAIPDDGAIVLVHVLNPYGMTWLRRFNENNVDLNRNFLAGDEDYAGAPESYAKLNTFLNPSTPPSADFFYLRAVGLILRHGMSTLKQAVAGGQFEYPNGLFFGGKRLEQGPQLYQDFIREHLDKAEKVVAIDVHTGLGPFGEDSLLVSTGEQNRMRDIFGARVQPLDPDESVAYRIRGGFYPRVLPRAKADFVCQEFGTYHPVRQLHALREENRWHQHGEGRVDHPTKRKLRDAFCPQDPTWRKSVLRRGAELIVQAVELAFQTEGPQRR